MSQDYLMNTKFSF